MQVNEAPGSFSEPAVSIRVSLLYRKNRQSTTVGTPESITKFAGALSKFANHCAQDGDDESVLVNSYEEIIDEILNVITRSTKGGSGNRSILPLRTDTDHWLLTITPIFAAKFS